MHESASRLLEYARARTKGSRSEITGFADLQEILETSSATMTNWKSRGVSKEGALKAEKKLGCSASWVLTGEGDDQATKKSVENSDGDLLIAQYDAAGAMGNGGLMLEEQPPGLIKSWKVDPEWLRLNVQHHTGIRNLCIVTGFGPSMKPKYNPGDPLLLDTGIKDVESGGDGVYFFRVGNHGFIKQLQRIPTESGLVLRAKSFNADYDPFEITPKMDFAVFGKVLTVWRSEQV
jgi:phage repressor protein C with HTH and peptisase S24 domain